MSSSQPKIKSATCPKCKQGFKFERVLEMASVVCPHCSAKIRLTRKKKSSSTEQSQDDSQANKDSRETERTQKQSPRLPVPELDVSKAKRSDAINPAPPADDFSNIDIPGNRQQASFDGLQVGGSDDSETAELDAAKKIDDLPNIRTRRNRERVDFSNLAIDDVESEIPDLNALQQADQRALASKRLSASSLETNQSVEDEIASADQADSEESKTEPPEVSDKESDLAENLLPPKFLVPDIEADENAVVLPTAGGGFQVVDKTEVRVMHEGRVVKLVSLSPEELKRVRLIENLVALLIAAIMLAIAAWLVL